MTRKKRVLLLWWYSRRDLTVPIVKLLPDHSFTGLYYQDKTDEPPGERVVDETIYWSDFKSPSDILSRVDPELLIFMGTESAKAVALRLSAAKKGLPCILIEHGIKNDLDWIKEHPALNPGGNSGNIVNRLLRKGSDVFRTLYFVMDGVKGYPASVKRSMLRMMYDLGTSPVELAMQNNQFGARWMDKYYLLAPFQYNWYKGRDGMPDELLSSVGNIFFDDFFQKYQHAAQEPAMIKGEYALIIDQSIPEMSLKERMELYIRLLQKLTEAGLKMVIKLHPEDYANPELQDYKRRMPGVEWFEAADIVNLIYHCKNCFSFYSTLLIPAIYFKPVYIFDYFNIPVVRNWIEMDVVHPVREKDLSDLDLRKEAVMKNKEEFREAYLVHTDGKSGLRLQEDIFRILNQKELSPSL